MKKMFLMFLVVLLVSVSAMNVYATEYGGGAYPNGAEDFMSGAVPPPGTYFLYYFNYYHADKFMDKDGKNAAPPGFDLKATADVFRFLHVTDKKILGGNWGMHIFIPYISLNLKAGGAKDNASGLGDIIVDPIVLSWHSKNWHFAAGVDVYIPTGSYDKNDMVSVGRNYWTFEPIFAFTYMSDSKFEVSGKFMYDINTKNNDTNYKSGQEFHFDYTIGQKIKDFSVGLGGYYYKQMTKDTGTGAPSDGNKGQVFAYGPQVKYDYKNMSFSAKYQKETSAENRPEGEKLWVKFSYGF